MILPDLNLILYAHNRGAASHRQAREWWETTLSSSRPVALCWAVILGFIRISTHRAIFQEPLSVSVACGEADINLVPFGLLSHERARSVQNW